MRLTVMCLSVLCTWPASICHGETNVLDFESLTLPGTGDRYAGIAYREDGFVVASVDGVHGLASFRTEDYGYSGSTALFNNTRDDWTSLSKSNAASFELRGITLSSMNDPITQTVRFYGYRGSSVVLTQACSMTDVTKSQSFTFSGFTNLTEVRWRNLWPGCQFDDLRVSSGAEEGPPVRLIPVMFNSVFLFDLVHLRVGKYYTLERSSDLVSWQAYRTNYARAAWLIDGDFVWQRERSFYRLSWKE